MQAEYARRVQTVQNDAQFLALMNELLARLHASHTRLYGPDDFEFYLLPEIMRVPANPLVFTVFTSEGGGTRVVGRVNGAARQLYQIGCLSAPDDPARIAAVLDGSPAAGAGLRAGDVLVTVDGRPYHGLTQFSAAPARLVYRRQGAEAAVTVAPASPSPLDLMLTATEKSARVITQPDGRKIGYVHL